MWNAFLEAVSIQESHDSSWYFLRSWFILLSDWLRKEMLPWFRFSAPYKWLAVVSLGMRSFTRHIPYVSFQWGQICICSWTYWRIVGVIFFRNLKHCLSCPVMSMRKLTWYFCNTWLHSPKLILKPGPSFCVCLANVVSDCIPPKLTQDVDVKALSKLIQIVPSLSEGLKQINPKIPPNVNYSVILYRRYS